MISKKAMLLSYVLSLMVLFCDAQKKGSNKTASYLSHVGDTTFFDKQLPEYQVNPCLSNLLISVVKSNSKFYSPSKYFYSLTFEQGKTQRYVHLAPEQWRKAKSLDYTGVLKFKNATFLCRGTFADDTIFKKRNLNQVRVRLVPVKDSSELIPFEVEPSLQGAFNDCKGMPIYIEIYTKAKPPGFEMKMHRAATGKEKQ